MKIHSAFSCIALLLAAGSMSGCGKDNTGAPSDPNPDPADIPLSPAPCVATFDKAYSVVDAFGDQEFSIRAGASFIMKSYSSFFGTRLYYPLAGGVYDFDVKKSPDGTYPFTTDCVEGNTETYLAAFRNTEVFSDSTLTRSLCTLPRGATAPAPGGTGYYLVGGFMSATYHVDLGGFSAACQGAGGGYLKASEAEAFGATTWLIPIDSYLTSAQ